MGNDHSLRTYSEERARSTGPPQRDSLHIFFSLNDHAFVRSLTASSAHIFLAAKLIFLTFKATFSLLKVDSPIISLTLPAFAFNRHNNLYHMLSLMSTILWIGVCGALS